MRHVARLLVAAAIGASFTVAAPPASACDKPPKCASCHLNPDFSLQNPKPIVCYS